jgi:GTPase Era involved in 16S rRNA processing
MKTEMTVKGYEGCNGKTSQLLRVIGEAARQSIIELQQSPVWTDVQSINVTVRKSWRKDLGCEVKIPTLMVTARATIVERDTIVIDLCNY